MRSLVALGAGTASVLMYMVAAKGVPGSVLVSYFTPLPIMITALGWGQSLGLAAASAGAVFLAIVLDPILGLRYALDFALPGWWLAYLALLARTDASGPGAPAPVTAWYPVGHVVLWAVAVAAFAAWTASLMFGLGSALMEQQMRTAAGRFAAIAHSAIGSTKVPTDKEVATLAAAMVRLLPIVGVVMLVILHLANLWVAGRVVQLSQRLARPWPKLPESLHLPRVTAPLFGVSLLLAIALPGAVGLAARMAAAGVGFALILQAMAVAHALSRGMRGRGTILAALYVVIFVLMPFSLMALTAVGLADLFLSLRDRKFRSPPKDHRSTED